MTIYNGDIGIGGSVVGTSSTTSTAAVTGYANPVTWTFTGGLQINDTFTYSAVVAPDLILLLSIRDPYKDGDYVNRGTRITGVDTVFQGTFSAATPVPFEFSPALGLGALWLAKKKLSNKTK